MPNRKKYSLSKKSSFRRKQDRSKKSTYKKRKMSGGRPKSRVGKSTRDKGERMTQRYTKQRAKERGHWAPSNYTTLTRGRKLRGSTYMFNPVNKPFYKKTSLLSRIHTAISKKKKKQSAPMNMVNKQILVSQIERDIARCGIESGDNISTIIQKLEREKILQQDLYMVQINGYNRNRLINRTKILSKDLKAIDADIEELKRKRETKRESTV